MAKLSETRYLFVTGAGSGIGREVAKYFARRGWFAGLADIDEAGLAETADMLPEDMRSVHRLDVTDRAGWRTAIEAFARASGGRLDLLFNNAGIGKGGPLEQMDPADIDALVAVNFTGVMNGTQAAFALLKATPGAAILNTCSASGLYGTANLSVYSATKFAVRGLTEAWDVEFRPHDIKVRSLMPGFVDTNILDDAAGEGSNMTGKQRLEAAGVEVSPVEILGEAAWRAIHGKAVHLPVNRTARQLAFAARWFPGRIRKRMLGLMGGLEHVVDSN